MFWKDVGFSDYILAFDAEQSSNQRMTTETAFDCHFKLNVFVVISFFRNLKALIYIFKPIVVAGQSGAWPAL